MFVFNAQAVHQAAACSALESSIAVSTWRSSLDVNPTLCAPRSGEVYLALHGLAILSGVFLAGETSVVPDAQDTGMWVI